MLARGNRKRGFARWWLLAAFAGVVVVLLVVREIGRSSKHRASPPPPPPRAERFRFCGGASVAALPAGMRVVDHALPGLGHKVLGQSVTFQGGGRSLQLYLGYDALGAAEDLDFDQRPSRVIRRRLIVMFQSKPLPKIRAATWAEPTLHPPCNAVTMITTGFTSRQLVRAVATVRLQGERTRVR